MYGVNMLWESITAKEECEVLQSLKQALKGLCWTIQYVKTFLRHTLLISKGSSFIFSIGFFSYLFCGSEERLTISIHY